MARQPISKSIRWETRAWFAHIRMANLIQFESMNLHMTWLPNRIPAILHSHSRAAWDLGAKFIWLRTMDGIRNQYTQIHTTTFHSRVFRRMENKSLSSQFPIRRLRTLSVR